MASQTTHTAPSQQKTVKVGSADGYLDDLGTFFGFGTLVVLNDIQQVQPNGPLTPSAFELPRVVWGHAVNTSPYWNYDCLTWPRKARSWNVFWQDRQVFGGNRAHK